MTMCAPFPTRIAPDAVDQDSAVPADDHKPGSELLCICEIGELRGVRNVVLVVETRL